MHAQLSSLTIAIALTALLGSAHADNHQPTDAPSADRRGLVAGFGLGLGVASIQPDVDGADRETRVGLTTDITVGWGVSDKLLATLMSRIVWFSLEGDITFSETAGVGVSYFLSDKVPSLYLSGGVGAALIVQPASDVIENQVGLGAIIGVGTELKPHWLVEFDVGIGAPGDFTSTVALVKVNYLHY